MKQILLIEDDFTMLSLLTTFLEIEGFGVLKPADLNALGVIDQIRDLKPDLILMDIHLNQINGLELLVQIKQETDLDKLPIIMSSGMDMEEECLQAGADDFILKPYMPDELSKKIERLLN